MVNYIFQLIAPRVITAKYKDVSFAPDRVIIRPERMSICHADQRYYTGSRDAAVLKKKLPMALIHECMGRVVLDPTGSFRIGERVVLIPNVPGTPVDGVFENYLADSRFASSGYDGFMREYVDLPPDRVVSCEGVDPDAASITELISVAVHAVTRLGLSASSKIGTVGVWGDGTVGYLAALVLKMKYPDAKVVVIGMNPTKLARFTFADEVYLADDLPDSFAVDHAFECAGGDGSAYAVDQIIDVIRPQGCVMLMGVSEKPIAVNTRMVLERGLTLIGCSRSGRADFENAVEYLRCESFLRRASLVITERVSVRSVEDIYNAFDTDIRNPFKTVICWNV